MLLLSFLCLCLCLALIKIFHKLWWTPIRIQHMMALQGIKGPSYRFIHGNNKEILSMKKEAIAKAIRLSHDILYKLQPHCHLWTNLYGKNFIQWYGCEAEFVITEPELIKEILNDRDGAYPKQDINVYNKKIFGDGLGASKGEKWAKMRKLANYAFHAESLRDMVPAMVASTETMLERWKYQEGKEIDVFEEFRLLTSEIISKTAFGSSYQEGKHIFEMISKLSIFIPRNLHKLRVPGISKFIKTTDQIESEKLEKEIHHSIKQIIKKREDKVMKGEEQSFGNDFLGILLQAHHDANEDQRISVENVIDECKTFYFTGQETTNTLLAWTVLLLAIHSDWQEEARKEVLNLFGQQIPNQDDITKLKTMNMIINETLRLYPPVTAISRKVKNKEVRLGKLILPPNMLLYMSTLAIHHDTQIWGEDVHLFKPERFSEGVAKATKNNIGAFFPFGIGPRTCVGFNFAFTEAKIALSMILQRYSFSLSPAYVHSPFQLITLRPQHGVQVILHSI
ncbi:cytochrome P450 CYP749A22-like [Ziziphus jujuba]|uniref:Cytochrome P450 CYP749A22-like n=1 Tax=Ziziphus jujuba TaxID=326968 RepID=A0A6P4AJN7_ZIZJJ|nr:cytochrome P450 CYP749A22-like [Ziziphus jujuba]